MMRLIARVCAKKKGRKVESQAETLKKTQQKKGVSSLETFNLTSDTVLAETY